MEVIIVGGGLVGSLCAVAMGKRGFNVKLMEKRLPLNELKNQKQRSINLALSVRGLTALSPYLDVKDKIPMYGRCIHPSLNIQPYSPFNKAIYSVDRSRLNEVLIEAAASMSNVEIYYNHTLVKCDFEAGFASFENNGKVLTYNADLIIGCDGAYSTTRSLMMKEMVMNYEQFYIDHLYAEIKVLPKNNEYAWNPNCLHIWPKHDYMLIALPNLDKSFTATLFMEKERFDDLTTEDQIISFFRSEFPDFIETVGEDQIIKDILNNPRSNLVSIKCFPYAHKKGLIIGDAAHAMVPFYGQGMNCGFEDVRLLTELLDKNGPLTSTNDLQPVLKEYSEQRKEDAHEIVELAMRNYVEMRHSVTSPLYKIRKKTEDLLHKILPNQIIPLYTMVSFSNIPYHEATKQHDFQTKLLIGIGSVAVVLPLIFAWIK